MGEEELFDHLDPTKSITHSGVPREKITHFSTHEELKWQRCEHVHTEAEPRDVNQSIILI